MTQPHDLTIAEASALMRRGDLSPVELTRSLLDRGRALEPRLHVWARLDEEAALAAAERSADALANEGASGALHGIPFGVKDIFYTEGVETTGCSKVYAGFTPDYDATAVAALKRAGALMLGKTITTEFAMFEPPPTRNPWNPDRTPGGSSSGSAAGVAARMFPLALGSQTAGSVLRPAAYNGVVGMKPTLGLISRYGVMPVSPSLDTMGFFTRSVEDAAIALGALARHDPNDDISLDTQPADYLAALDSVPRPRIALMRQYFLDDASPDVAANVDSVAGRLADEGAEVEEIAIPFDLSAGREAHSTVQTAEAAHSHQADFARGADLYMPTTRRVIEAGLAISAVEYMNAQAQRAALRRELLTAIAGFDAILTPSTRTPAPDTTTTGDPACQWAWTTAGFPAISTPSGISADGLPLGVQFAAAPLREDTLLGVARFCERALDLRLAPPLAI